MNIDELFYNIEFDGSRGDVSQVTILRHGSIGNVKVDEAWREIDGDKMTPEDFLARARAMREDVRVSSSAFGLGQFGVMDQIRGGRRGRKRGTMMNSTKRAVL